MQMNKSRLQPTAGMALAVFVLLTSYLPAAHAQDVVLSQENYAQWRDHILPASDDLTWQKIPWLITYADGVVAADNADKPMLLWVMNGHPLGCT